MSNCAVSSAELRAELYKELLDASSDEKLRERSRSDEQTGLLEDSTDTNVKRLSDKQ